jgi:hypothetical protein
LIPEASRRFSHYCDCDRTLADRTVTRFQVSKVIHYAKTDFPDQLVFGSHDTRSLQFVTCGGLFDSSTGHDLANIVVLGHLVSVSRHRG